MENLSATDLAEAAAHASNLGSTLRRCFAAWVTINSSAHNGHSEHLKAAKEMDKFLAGDSAE